METTTELVSIGDALSFDQTNFNNTIRQSKEIMPAINKMAELYESLNLGAFDQSVFTELVKEGIENTRGRLYAIAEEDLKQFKSSIVIQSAKADIDAHLIPLGKSLENLHNTIVRVNHSNRSTVWSNQFTFDHSSFEIVNGKAELKEQQVRRYYTKTITNENQIIVFNAVSELVNHYNNVVALLKSLNIKTLLSEDSSQCFMPRILDESRTKMKSERRINKAALTVVK